MNWRQEVRDWRQGDQLRRTIVVNALRGCISELRGWHRNEVKGSTIDTVKYKIWQDLVTEGIQGGNVKMFLVTDGVASELVHVYPLLLKLSEIGVDY
jgi:hypothetical protein